MAYDDDLLKAARLLLVRRSGQRGRLSGARVRRSVSTAYYALFHFLVAEVSAKIVGSRNDLRISRRILARTITHRGLRVALDKVRGAAIHDSVQLFLNPGNDGAAQAAPPFAQNIARAFIDAQSKRESADYDLNEPLSEADARILRLRVRRVIRNWRAANSSQDREFKHALAILILLKGQLRQEI